MEYMPLEDVERFEGYRPGGYHPTGIGDLLHDGRYRIVHKLGFGGYSIIWLARDLKINRYVAIKIMIANGNSQDCNILRHLGDLKNNDSAKSLISSMSDEFVVAGPNGEHRCVVTAPASMSLSDAKDASYSRLFQLSTARVIAAQLVQAIAFLHSRGIVHADIHPGNILLPLSRDINILSLEELYLQYGRPNLEPIKRLDNSPLAAGVPTHAVVPMWLGKNGQHISPTEASGILLTDFGESFQPSVTIRHHSNTTIIFSPPEVRFMAQVPLSFPSDIWSLACTIYSILGTGPPFEGFPPSGDYVTKEHVDTLCKLPPKWWEKWEARSKWFDEHGKIKDTESERPWEKRFSSDVEEPRRECSMEKIGDAEKAALFNMLKEMLAFRPNERLTSAEALNSKWMQEWALPELEMARKIR
ncbi:uncharacterized protein GIQ15_04063 [Arthroderma uncinatum]|uniref:uncharacterized protein n=1 Tax=Arthroderma uncinatum TaxID=74035 RepID=UPI00144A8D69|nr:uncharacterized protein GIQ15_04063 [Arthroderma uncinatum]KAF3481304.1 hypothetical protein GIQ15_04063 [Arthroderma uncinatum]